MIHKCAHCSSSYKTCDASSRFCSRPCYWASMSTLTEKTCGACGKKYAPTSADRKYCSHECYSSVPRPGYSATCLRCGEEFRTSHKRSKYCGRSCYAASKLGSIPWNKGVPSVNAPWKGKKRSAESIAKMKASKLASGYKHPPEVRQKIAAFQRGRSKGGSTNIIASIRGCWRYKEWRKSVFDRDQYTCQCCGKRGEVNADHIVPFAWLLRKFVIKSLDQALACDGLWLIANGRTLCVPCHKKTPTFAYGTRDVYIPDALKTAG